MRLSCTRERYIVNFFPDGEKTFTGGASSLHPERGLLRIGGCNSDKPRSRPFVSARGVIFFGAGPVANGRDGPVFSRSFFFYRDPPNANVYGSPLETNCALSTLTAGEIHSG